MIAAETSSPSPHIASPLDELVHRAQAVPVTVAQYYRMIHQKILPENGAYELLRGVVVRKDRSSRGGDPIGHGPPHSLVVALLIQLASKVNSAAHHLRIQLPVDCPPYGSPEPDASIIRGQPRDYQSRNPSGSDCSCVIEVADSSLHRDQTDKLMTYAGAGIPQYIIINLESLAIEVHTDPDRHLETYQTRITLQARATLKLALPDGMLTVQAAELLPA